MLETVRIYCEGSASHPHRRREVATMRRRRRADAEGRIGWTEDEMRRGRSKTSEPGQPITRVEMNDGYRPVGEVLIAEDGRVLPGGARRSVAYESRDRPVAHFDLPDGGRIRLRDRWDLDATRTRHAFRCRCTLNVLARDSNLWTILDSLSAEGIAEISLPALRRLIA